MWGKWQHQNTKIHMGASYSSGIFLWLFRILKATVWAQFWCFSSLKMDTGKLLSNLQLELATSKTKRIFCPTAIVELMCEQSVLAVSEFFKTNHCQLYNSWQKRVPLHICLAQLQAWSGNLSEHLFSICHITHISPTADSCKINMGFQGLEYVSVLLDNNLVWVRGQCSL